MEPPGPVQESLIDLQIDNYIQPRISLKRKVCQILDVICGIHTLWLQDWLFVPWLCFRQHGCERPDSHPFSWLNLNFEEDCSFWCALLKTSHCIDNLVDNKQAQCSHEDENKQYGKIHISEIANNFKTKKLLFAVIHNSISVFFLCLMKKLCLRIKLYSWSRSYYFTMLWDFYETFSLLDFGSYTVNATEKKWLIQSIKVVICLSVCLSLSVRVFFKDHCTDCHHIWHKDQVQPGDSPKGIFIHYLSL